MRIIFYKLLLLGVLCLPLQAWGQTISNIAAMSFGSVEDAGGGNRGLQMGTDGNVIYIGNVSGNGVGSAASALIGGTTGLTVGISCEKIATLSDGLGGTVGLKNIGATMGVASATSFAGMTLCKGFGRRKDVFQHVLTGIPAQDTLLLGGEITISGQPQSGNFSTANTGGSPFAIRVVYQ